MTTHRRPARRTFGDHFQATFGHVNARRLRNRALLTLGIAAVLSTGAASADWRVYDDNVERVLEQIRDDYIQKDGGSVTTHLKTINERLTIKGDELKTAEDSGDKDHTLVVPREANDKLKEAKADRARPTDVPESSVGMAKRCPGGGGVGTGIPAQQKTVCEEIYKTEIARYRFSLEMYELAETRNTKLKALVDERNALEPKDFGKMEENTNKLLALQVQMDNDRDRYQTYMQAYDARIDHLVKTKDLLAEQALQGNKSGSSIPGTVVGAAVLTAALAVGASSGERDDLSGDNPFR